MTFPIFQVDAFTDHLFGGNPAAVVPLENWLPDQVMQNISAENNLAETAFFVKEPSGFHIRWFTPLAEVDLCGHATLATAHVLFHHLDFAGDLLEFQSKSGILRVRRDGDLLTLDFPIDTMKKVSPPDDLAEAIGRKPLLAFKGKTDYMLVYASQQEIEKMKPNQHKLMETEARGVIITAPGDAVDFVSRFFAPQVGVPEDHVTGSAHTSLTPYWSKRLNKQVHNAMQLSKRKGHLRLTMKDGRVEISGKAVTYLKGEIYIDL
ncbi:MAG: PhzF family phenazine biosynthesis protein [Bacteroidota bacterium]